jgi:hypothetical protein
MRREMSGGSGGQGQETRRWDGPESTGAEAVIQQRGSTV